MKTMKNTKLQIQEIEQIPNRFNLKKAKLKYFIVTLLKNKTNNLIFYRITDW